MVEILKDLKKTKKKQKLTYLLKPYNKQILTNYQK